MNISNYVPEWALSLTPSEPRKPIEEVEREYGIHDSIKTASNENSVGPSPKAVAATFAHLYLYPYVYALHLKKLFTEKFGISFLRLIPGNGSNELNGMSVRIFLRSGESIVVHKAYLEFVNDSVSPDSYGDRTDWQLIVTLRTFAKICCLAGLRVGYGVVAPENIGELNRVGQPFDANNLAQVGARAALDDGRHFRREQKHNAQGVAYAA